MMHYRGQIIAVRPCGGCVEVIVRGQRSGRFPIDNSCFRMIRDIEGPVLLGRQVEYCDGHLRFLDADDFEDTPQETPATIPFPTPARSRRHA
ncbi:MAG: hypothetical protein JXA69_08215 [Phycisphaerae bacterium]|nr:hypothetical protein [Phycisphaerae bacterium]